MSSTTLHEYLLNAKAAGIIDHKVRVEAIHASGPVEFYIRPANHDGETINFFSRANHVGLAAQAAITLFDEFEHMLAYTGLGAEPGEIKAKLLHAFAAGRGESIPEGSEDSAIPQKPTAIETCSRTLFTSSCEIKNLHPYEKEGNLALFRMESGEHLMLSSAALRTLASDADLWAKAGKSLLVDIGPRDPVLVAEGGSRFFDVDSRTDALFDSRIARLRQDMISQAEALGLSVETVEVMLNGALGAAPMELHKLSIGDSVWLKTGSPEMTVDDIKPGPDGATVVEVHYTDAHGTAFGMTCDTRQLSLLPVNPPTPGAERLAYLHDPAKPIDLGDLGAVPAPVQSIEIKQTITRDPGDQQSAMAAAEDLAPAHGDQQ